MIHSKVVELKSIKVLKFKVKNITFLLLSNKKDLKFYAQNFTTFCVVFCTSI